MATFLKRTRETRRPQPTSRSVNLAPAAPPVTVVIRPEILRSIAAFAGAAPGRETGGPLIGTVQPSWEEGGTRLIASVMATVPPGPMLRAGAAHVALGQGGDGERAASALRWWRDVTGLDLQHLGDWHKHHSATPEPSRGDAATAQRMSAGTDAPVWITAVAIGALKQHEDAKPDGPVVRFSRSSQAYQEVRFYRQVGRLGLAPLEVRVEAHAVPRLPELPWHVTDPARFSAECRLLMQAGFRVAIQPWSGKSPGLELRLQNGRMPSLAVVTGPGYPFEPPVVLDDRRRRLPPPAGWSPARFLVDVVRKGTL
jgi:hypothetical protein